MKMHFKGKDPEKERFTTLNPFTRKPMVFLLDPSVNNLLILATIQFTVRIFTMPVHKAQLLLCIKRTVKMGRHITISGKHYVYLL